LASENIQKAKFCFYTHIQIIPLNSI